MAHTQVYLPTPWVIGGAGGGLSGLQVGRSGLVFGKVWGGPVWDGVVALGGVLGGGLDALGGAAWWRVFWVAWSFWVALRGPGWGAGGLRSVWLIWKAGGGGWVGAGGSLLGFERFWLFRADGRGEGRNALGLSVALAS